MHSIARDGRSPRLSVADAALCEYAEKMTLTPSELDAADLDRLRRLGFSDRAIHDATQVVGYFNYITRVAEGLGVEPEDFIHPWGGALSKGR